MTNKQTYIQHLFEAQVERTPGAVAIAFEGSRVTYGDLNRRINQLAHYLRAHGVDDGLAVGLNIEYSIEFVVGLLGILKAGGTLVFLDPSHPQNWQSEMLQYAHVQMVVTREKETANLPTGSRTICLDSEAQAIAQHSQENEGLTSTNNIASLFYTSGRYIMLEHRQLHSSLKWLQKRFTLSTTDTLLSTSSPTEENALLDSIWTLTTGACLLIARREGLEDSKSWEQILARYDVSVLHASAPSLRPFVDIPFPSTLRLVLASGEPPSHIFTSAFTKTFAGTFSYLHGGLEAAYYLEMNAEDQLDDRDSMAIGRVASMAVYILDARKQLVPLGGKGEIYVAGSGVARGYLDDLGEIERSFLADPYTDARMFRTGLQGRYRSGGKVEIQGLRTRQIWLGGHSITLDEVENALLRNVAMRGCRVIARKGQNGDQELVAYVVTTGQGASEIWQEQLRSYLPEAWVPRIYIPVSHLPLTSNGEVDNQLLLGMAPVTSYALAQWEEYLQKQEGVEHVAVVAQKHSTVQPPLHLADILPEYEALAGASEEATPPSTDQSRGEENPGTGVASSTVASVRGISWSDGGPLSIPASAPKTLTEALVQTALLHKDKGLLVVQSDGSEVFQSYPTLLEKARSVMAGLYEHGLRPGDRAILQVETLQDHFVAFWGCVLGGIRPVTVAIAPTYTSLNAVVNKLCNVWELLEHPHLLTNTSHVEALRGLEVLCGMKGLNILAVDELKAYAPAEQFHESQPHDVIFYQLTSGSTGTPKCIQETHRGIIAHIHGSAQFNGYTSDDVTLNWLPMDHVVPILTFHLKDVYLGCQQIHVKTDRILSQPLRWLDLIEAKRVTHSWSPNFGFKLISDRLAVSQGRAWDLSSIKLFMNAGEQVTLPVVRDFLHNMVPFGVRQQAMQPAFGMAEVCTCMTYQNTFEIGSGRYRVLKSSLGGALQLAGDNTDDAAVVTFIDLGPPMPGVQIRITDSQNKVLPEGVIGQFQIKGEVLTPGYLYNNAANQESFVGDGWFNSGDLGFILNGRLTLTGRAKEMIIIRGANFYCYEIEDVVNAIEGVEPTFVGACGIEDASIGTEGLGIFFVPKTGTTEGLADLIRTIRRDVTAQLGIAPRFIVPLAKEQFPKTTSGKIQRSQLKKSLAAGEYKELLKHVDLLLENVNTIPNWFYRKCWQPQAISQQRRHEDDSVVLLFMDEEGAGEALCEQLRQRRQRYICVRMGARFEWAGDELYHIEPGNQEDYYLLSKTLVEEQLVVKQVVHLWGYAKRRVESISEGHFKEEWSRGLLSVLSLVQALERERSQGGNEEEEEPIKLVVVSSEVAVVQENEEPVCEKSLVVGLLKTFERELPWLQCIHIDVPMDNKEQDALYVLHELYNNLAEQEVAYRGGKRFVARLEHIDWSEEASQPLPLLQKGLYLISGGLGGVGYELARHLLQEYQAHLLLIGRTPVVPDRSAGVATSTPETPATRLAALQDLAQLGGAVRYEPVDVCDLEGLRRAVKLAQQQWGSPLEGVFHLAGMFREQPLLLEQPGQIEQVLRPKVEGIWTLHQLLKDRPEALFVSFSSVNAFFGGSGVGAYAAANCFLESFAHYQRVHCGLRSYCIGWSMWDEVGISRNYHLKGFSQTSGYRSIAPQHGWYSLLAILHRAPASLLVGLDGSNQHIRHHLVGPVHALQEAVAYISPRLPRGVWSSEWGVLPGNYRLVPLATVPLKETGEIDIQRLGGLDHATGQAVEQEPRSELEQQMREIWRLVLNNPQVGVQDNFFELGGHSLLATQVVARLQSVLQINVPVRSLIEHPTIADLTQAIERQQQTRSIPALVPVSRDRPLPPSFAQQRLWFLDQLEPGSTAYNIPITVEFVGRLDLAAFMGSLAHLIKRHEGLRTTFHERAGQLYQVIDSRERVDIILIDLQALAPDRREMAVRELSDQETRLPFDLSKGPLLRCRMVRLAEQTHWVRLNMHHIVSDGWSMGIFVRELTSLYRAHIDGENALLAPLPIQYADYAYWQRQWLQGDVLKEQVRYWTHQLSGAHALELPADYPRPRVRSHQGARYRFESDPALAQALARLSRQEGATLFMTLLAAFQVLLYRLSGDEDIVVGTDSANRSHLETEGLIGFFVNLLALRTTLQGNPRFLSVLHSVRAMVLGAYEHMELPFEMIVEHLHLERKGNRTPLVNVLFVMQNVPRAEADFPDVVLRSVNSEADNAKFDLAFFLFESPDGLRGAVNYSTDLFNEATIAKIMTAYNVLLHDLVARPEAPVDSLEILSAAEKEERESIEQHRALDRKSKLRKIDRSMVE